MGLAAHLATADPEDFTPRAWQKALEQANTLEVSKDAIPSRQRDRLPLTLSEARTHMEVIKNRGLPVNGWPVK